MTSPALFVETAAAPHAALVRAAARVPLDVPTPCAAWTLHDLLNHLLHRTPVLAAVGAREPVPAPEEGADLVTGDWPDRLDDDRAHLAAAWSRPDAWVGSVRMIGPDPFPASIVGGMALVELVLHGWDLGCSLGVRPEWPEDVAAGALQAMRAMAEQGREMGVFGPELSVPDDATTLDRLVALSGRDPGWTG